MSSSTSTSLSPQCWDGPCWAPKPREGGCGVGTARHGSLSRPALSRASCCPLRDARGFVWLQTGFGRRQRLAGGSAYPLGPFQGAAEKMPAACAPNLPVPGTMQPLSTSFLFLQPSLPPSLHSDWDELNSSCCLTVKCRGVGCVGDP